MIADLTDLAEQLHTSPLHGDGGGDDTTAFNDGWNEATDQLLAIRSLEDDWDGLGANAPATSLVDSALRLAGWLQGKGYLPPSRIVPSLTGTVLFEWQAGGGTQLEVEVTAPAKGHLTLFREGQPTLHQSL